jgi:hypothetical protein
MREFAAMRRLDVWYSRIDVSTLLELAKGSVRTNAQKALHKARTRTVFMPRRSSRRSWTASDGSSTTHLWS